MPYVKKNKGEAAQLAAGIYACVPKRTGPGPRWTPSQHDYAATRAFAAKDVSVCGREVPSTDPAKGAKAIAVQPAGFATWARAETFAKCGPHPGPHNYYGMTNT